MPALQACALCGNRAQLQKSHVIPKFVGEWLKKTSATGYLREPTSPNIRKQDLPTKRLLCGQCEQRFGQWENQIARELFRPFQKQRLALPRQPVFAYDESLRRFAVSLAWRIAMNMLDGYRKQEPELASFVAKAMATWRHYLLHEYASPGPYEHHLLFLDMVGDTNIEVPNQLHAYMLRDIDATIVTVGQMVFTYIKLPGMVFLAGIEPPVVAGWENTRIDRSGNIGLPQRVDDGWFGDFLLGRVVTIESKMATMSAVQRERIVESLRQNPDRAAKSLTLEAIQADERWRQQDR